MTLRLVSNTRSILHRPTQAVSKEQILSRKFRQRTDEMIAILRAARGAGLAAPQVGWGVQVFLVEDRPEYFEHHSKERLALIERVAFPLTVICNPILEITDPTMLAYFEGCLSYPKILGAVLRVRGVRIKFLDMLGREQTLTVTGWPARILQHEFDHLKGKDFLSNFLPGSEMRVEEFLRDWKSATSEQILAHFRDMSFLRHTA